MLTSDIKISKTPKEIVNELSKFIVGQSQAKKFVAIALRNRWRRMQLPELIRNEIIPKNILMIGPTGVGKTEISRRLAKISNAPFLKVDATKFTEVGYVGKDVDSIVRDLLDKAIKMYREQEKRKVMNQAKTYAENKILDILVPPRNDVEESDEQKSRSSARKIFREKIRSGEIDSKKIEVDTSNPKLNVEIMGPPGIEEVASQLENIVSTFSQIKKKKKRKIEIKKALKILTQEESEKLIDEEEIKNHAISEVEENGIIFIDEIDKICGTSGRRNGEVSREGVQRDLLPLIEGCSISTKYGVIKTDHILFICSGAFHSSRPSDLLAELQGRLPIRVKLKPLSINDLIKILKEPRFSLIKQYSALLKTENINISFNNEAIEKLANIAFFLNQESNDVGARRLYMVIEKLLEDISFEIPQDGNITIDSNFVESKLSNFMEKDDLRRYIL